MTACAECGYESPQAFRFCPECGTEAVAPAHELRKTVTVLFSDMVGSTSLGERLDPEALRRVVGRYFDEVRTILERHGGTLEKFIGDAVVALFGVPVAREDDALRALRAADEIRERLQQLNDDFERELGVRIGIRTGISTGEVVVGEGSAEGFAASGDTMNVAARLEQAASAGEVLVGAETRLLGGDAIVVEEVEPLALKGKSEPVPAFRLVRVLPHASPYGRREDAPLVGRRRELDTLHEALRAAVESRSCVLVTVVGAAGVGKSRLVRELLAPLGDDVRVLVGRCAAYGEGITFLPLAEALRPALGPDPRAGALELLASEERAELVADQVAALLGESGAAGSTEDVFWAVRRLLEELAADRPVVLVVDDVHWAEPTLLDLLEYVATFSAGAPILLVCPARPDLLEARPTWTAPRENAVVVALSPLAESESAELVGFLLDGSSLGAEERRRVVDAADGNPLFLEQLLALNTGARPDAALVVPSTIQALLDARLDQLEAGERRVLECAAVEGREFTREAVIELLPEGSRGALDSDLLALARRQFIRRVRRGEPGEDAFSFAHVLVRDAAYAAIPKETRAELHLRLADHLERRGAVELVGFHLADAVRYRRELGRVDDATQAVARRAAELLGAAGRRAVAQGDDRAAAKLLGRATDLLSSEEAPGRALRFDLGRALVGAGELESAREVLAEVEEAARARGERALELRAGLELVSLRSRTDAEIELADLVSAAEHAIPEFERASDEVGLAMAWQLVHWARFRAARYTESLDAAERAVEHARRAGDRRAELLGVGAIAMATLVGPTPAEEGLGRCDELVAQADGARLVDAFVARVRGCFLGMIGEFERGLEECRRSIEIYEELGLRISAIGAVCELAPVLRQAGRLEEAERELRTAYESLVAIGDIGYVSWVGPLLARSLAERGAYPAARELARRCREETQRDHAFGQIAARHAEALALLGEGKHAAAEALALDALALVQETDTLEVHGDVLLVLARLDRAAGRDDLAHARQTEAVELFERKGDVVSAARAKTSADL